MVEYVNVGFLTSFDYQARIHPELNKNILQR